MQDFQQTYTQEQRKKMEEAMAAIAGAGASGGKGRPLDRPGQSVAPPGTSIAHSTRQYARNGLCPCGSLKKYKMCCLHKQQEQEAV